MLFTKLKPSLVESFKQIVSALPADSSDFSKLSHKFSLFLITQCRHNLQTLSDKSVFEKIYAALSNSNFEENQNFIKPNVGLAENILSDFTSEERETQKLIEAIRSIDQVG